MQSTSDDTHGSGANTAQGNPREQPTQFLDLPAELRRKVYGYVVPEDVPGECYPDWSSGKLPRFIVPVELPVLAYLSVEAHQYCLDEMRFTTLITDPEKKNMVPYRAFRPDIDTLCLLEDDSAAWADWVKAMNEHFHPRKRRRFPPPEGKKPGVLKCSAEEIRMKAYEDQYIRPWTICNVRIGAMLPGWEIIDTVPYEFEDDYPIVKIARMFRGVNTNSAKYLNRLEVVLYESESLPDNKEFVETIEKTWEEIAEGMAGNLTITMVFNTLDADDPREYDWVVGLAKGKCIHGEEHDESFTWSRPRPATLEE